MKSKFWNGSFLRTVLQCLAVVCALLLAFSAAAAGLALSSAIDQKQLPIAACVICFAAVFSGGFLAAKHAAGQKLPAALAVAGCCLFVCFLSRLLFFGNTDSRILPIAAYTLTAGLLAGIVGSTRKKNPRRRRR